MSIVSTIIIIATAFGQDAMPESPQNPQESPYLMNNSEAFVPYGTSQIGEPYTTGSPQSYPETTTSEGIAPTPTAVDPAGR